jgi:hypothetical protein
MAKEDLINEAKQLGIEVSDQDTIATLTKKIAEKKAEDKKAPPVTTPEAMPAGMKRIKITDKAQLRKVQADGKLYDWNSETKEAVIKE